MDSPPMNWPAHRGASEFEELDASTPGIVHSAAVVTGIDVGDQTLYLAVDAASEDAKSPDVLRISTEKDDFRKASVAELDIFNDDENFFRARSKQAVIVLNRDARELPVTIRAHYYKRGGRRHLSTQLAAAMEGTCEFGGKEHAVRLFDATGNLAFDDEADARQIVNYWQTPADMLEVDLSGRGDFSRTAVAIGGQPVQVDGRWYTWTRKDGALSSQPLDAETGELELPEGESEMLLAGDDCAMYLRDVEGAVSLPAGRYNILQCSWRPRDDDRLNLYGNRSRKGSFVVKTGETAKLPIAAPLDTLFQARPAGVRTVRLSLRLQKEDMNLRVGSIVINKQAPPKPTVEILGPDGETIDSISLEYG
jgi:hypothetical protein